jgi:hypothetical protein
MPCMCGTASHWHLSVQCPPRAPASTSAPWVARSWTRPPRQRQAMQQVLTAVVAITEWRGLPVRLICRRLPRSVVCVNIYLHVSNYIAHIRPHSSISRQTPSPGVTAAFKSLPLPAVAPVALKAPAPAPVAATATKPDAAAAKPGAAAAGPAAAIPSAAALPSSACSACQTAVPVGEFTSAPVCRRHQLHGSESCHR